MKPLKKPAPKRKKAPSADCKGCVGLDKKLSAYVEGELPKAQQAKARSHVKGCQSCQDQIDALMRLLKTCQCLPKARPSADLHQRLKALFKASLCTEAPRKTSKRS